MTAGPGQDAAPARDDGGLRLRRGDLAMLTKARLSLMVVVTTAAGFLLAQKGPLDGWRLVHTIFGTLLAAFGSAVFNQLMEMEADARMKRTAGRPLPARRMPSAAAFLLGMFFCGWGIIHLDRMVNTEAAALAAATIGVYIFIYTPLKVRSSLNTLVGGVSGALPPLIGWAGAFGPAAEFRWHLLVEQEALFLFSLLFLWQMPHFLAINWMYRDEYAGAGFVMWSNGDHDGRRTGRLALAFSVWLLPLALWPWAAGFAGGAFAVAGLLMGGGILALAWRFWRLRTRRAARTLFLATLLYLPLMLGALLVTAR